MARGSARRRKSSTAAPSARFIPFAWPPTAISILDSARRRWRTRRLISTTICGSGRRPSGRIRRTDLGKIHSVRLASYRNIYPGFGKTKVEDPPANFDYDMWLGPAPKRPYQAHRGLYHFRWFWDYSGGQMTNLGAHLIDQIMWIMNVKGPTLVQSGGGRFALEDDGETPDVQDAIWTFPGFTMTCSIREANAMRGDPAARGQLYLGTKGSLVQVMVK